jgi:metal-responsive CopG/Arc/MetJ family transcriptional regulator
MRILLDLPDATVDALGELAKAENKSRSALIRQAVDDYLAKRRVEREREAFGLWGNRKVDGLAYQRKVRGEW